MPIATTIATGISIYGTLSKSGIFGRKDSRMNPKEDKYVEYTGQHPHHFLQFHVKDGLAFFDIPEIRQHFQNSYGSLWKGSVGEHVMKLQSGYKGIVWDGQTWRDANLFGVDARGKTFAGKKDAISIQTSDPKTYSEFQSTQSSGSSEQNNIIPLLAAGAALYFTMK